MRAKLRAGLLTAAGALLSLAGASLPARAFPGQDSLTVTITPRDQWTPAAITDLVATPGGEGQLLLQWTAPDGNNGAFAQTQQVASYQLRIATFPASSFPSTTTWWNAATAVSAPTPSQAGTLETSLLNALEPGATFWAAIVSVDPAGNISPIDTKTAAVTQAKALVADLTPPTPVNVRVTAVTGVAITVAWDAVAASDLWNYRVYADSTPPFDFSDQFTVTVASGASPSYTKSGLIPGTSVYFRVTAVDKGAPTYNGFALESPVSATVIGYTPLGTIKPLPPFGITISTTPSSATIGWMPVTALETGDLFEDPSKPTAIELSGYRVYRATSAVAAPWTSLVTVSTYTYSYTDNTATPDSYYMVEAFNPAGSSKQSMVRAVATKQGYIVAYDGLSSFQMGDDVATLSINGKGQTSDAYLVLTSSHPEQLGEGVLKAVEFTALKQGVTPDPTAKLSAPGTLLLHYQYDKASGAVQAGSLHAASANGPTTPDQMSVFWNNGAKWVQLYGQLDAANQVMMVQTPYLGQYQLRAAERASGFTFDTAGLSNKMLTPNGDGKNDTVVFQFDNPRHSEVVGRIFDIRGRHVTDMTPGPSGDTLMWDGKAGGMVVPGGVYIYSIEAEGSKTTGTVIVVK